MKSEEKPVFVADLEPFEDSVKSQAHEVIEKQKVLELSKIFGKILKYQAFDSQDFYKMMTELAKQSGAIKWNEGADANYLFNKQNPELLYNNLVTYILVTHQCEALFGAAMDSKYRNKLYS